MKPEEIKNEILAIKVRNTKVEAEKAWETSWERKGLVVCITYIFMIFFMNLIGVEKVMINALVPTFGFFLSTLSLSFLKEAYINKYLNSNLK